ncbi:hypothetical protein KV102_12320 [Mumia sp. zg.B53]|nr:MULTISPECIES: hypothetical protein [unclassified Mumia]MBW9206652.1 hypothetical protein [Mumia sp. zg.B17]MBW9211058.1 hypothetical protein [Mumia sp. zg.B21]MBW9215626.1 hypothetical protein [Mumia sp. zg.B53]MDD9347886.1 hypothetical protein [Mumia sp.]
MYIDPESSVVTEMKHRIERLSISGDDRRAESVRGASTLRRRGRRH